MRKLTTIILVLALMAGLAVPALAADNAALDKTVTATAAYMLSAVSDPQVGSIGGEWAVIGLARSGYAVPDAYYESYYETVAEYVTDCGGVLHDKKYTEYSRVILGLTAAGYDPRDVAGYDLTLALGDFEKTIWQGINGPVWALIALDSMNYPIPENRDAETQATRELYIDEILRRQTPDGGWNLSAGSGGTQVGASERANSDLTGMALQALAKYQNRADVKAATDKALACLSAMQDGDGGFGSSFSAGSSAVESVVQALVALCELGIPVDDARFVKNGHSLMDNILSFSNGDGSYRHTADGSGSNQMSTEQALYGLVAAQRAADGKNSLYGMSDAVKRGGPGQSDANGLPGKHAQVNRVPVSAPGKTFADISKHANQAAIEALAARGMIDGMGDGTFQPDATMTRAQYAAIITRGLGLLQRTPAPFSDVASGTWYEGYIGAAFYYEIITGRNASEFDPDGLISVQEAAAMTARAAGLCGMDTNRTATEIRDALAQFPDYMTVAEYARSPLAFCFSEGLLDDDTLNIEPARSITRCEIAEMLYRMLGKAALL